MPLTMEEAVYANTLLEQFARRRQGWGILRWALLVMGAALVISSLIMPRGHLFVPTERPRATITMPVATEGAQREIDGLRQDMSDLRWEVSELRSDSMMASFEAVTNSTVAFVIGIFGFVVAATHWNDHKRNALLVKVIREKFKEELALEGKM